MRRQRHPRKIKRCLAESQVAARFGGALTMASHHAGSSATFVARLGLQTAAVFVVGRACCASGWCQLLGGHLGDVGYLDSTLEGEGPAFLLTVSCAAPPQSNSRPRPVVVPDVAPAPVPASAFAPRVCCASGWCRGGVSGVPR